MEMQDTTGWFCLASASAAMLRIRLCLLSRSCGGAAEFRRQVNRIGQLTSLLRTPRRMRR